MANILTYIELTDREATPASLYALNQGRRLASELGATLYALLPCAATPSYDDNDIIAVLSRHGADKVLLLTHQDLGGPAFFATHGEALISACHQFPPRLLLFPSTAAGQDLAPRIALSLGGQYAANAKLSSNASEGYQIVRNIFRRRFCSRESLSDCSRALVLTLCQQGSPEVMGDDEAEVVVIRASMGSPSPLEIQAKNGISIKNTATARIVVAGGSGLQDKASFSLLGLLAEKLGGAVAASHSACAAGLAAPDWQVGLDGAGIEADLYLAFGISGSERHLASLAPHTKVVAINSDPDAPIFSYADYVVTADAPKMLKDLVEKLCEGEAA